MASDAAYEAVLFDFDGVLVDSEPVHYGCWVDILTPLGITLDWQTYCEHCIGIADRAMLAFLCSLQTPPMDVESLAVHYPRKKEMFRERMGAIGIAADVRELLVELRERGFKVAVVTSSHTREVSHVLDAAGVTDLLDVLVHGGEVARHKPAPDPYLLAMDRLAVTRGLAVEDSRAGIAAARAAGLDVVEIASAGDVCRLVRTALG